MAETVNNPVIQTERLWLRRLATADLDALYEVLGDPMTMAYYPRPLSRQETAGWIERVRQSYEQHGHGLYALVLKQSGEMIGDCGLIRQTVEDRIELEVAYHVRRDHWNRGYATEAARACMDYGFREFAPPRLISLIRPENLPSRRVAEKNGMVIDREVIWRDLPHLIYATTQSRAASDARADNGRTGD